MNPLGGWILLLATCASALALARRPATRHFAFPTWVMAFVVASLLRPEAFGVWLGLDLKALIVPLIQVITFGMGTTLSPVDFARVLKIPWPVFIGFALQFTVMPALGWMIATGLGFEPEVAAGLILVGCVSGGVASNLVTYLAGGNVALSVTMTACSTFASPFLTPVLMKTLAGRLVPIDVVAMMLDILNMILVPVLAGLLGHRILYGKDPALHRAGPLAGLAAVGLVLAFLAARIIPAGSSGLSPLRNGLILGAGLLGLVALAKLVMTVLLHRKGDWMDRTLTWVSMAGICFIIAIITARSRDKLLTVGPLLILAAALLNTLGYLLGYGAARAARLDERTARTVAIEVGMQNSGMAAGLALGALQSANAALAAAVYGPWMNISGSLLAGWWKRRPPAARKQP